MPYRDERYRRRARKRNRIVTIVVLALLVEIIVMIVLGQSRRGSGRRPSGCGCSPIGWILGGLGIGEWIRRNR